MGGGGISLVAGLFTLFTLGLRLGDATAVVPPDGGVLLAMSSPLLAIADLATASRMAGGWSVVMGGVWGVAWEEGGGGGGRRRGLWGSSPLSVVRRLRCLAIG